MTAKLIDLAQASLRREAEVADSERQEILALAPHLNGWDVRVHDPDRLGELEQLGF